MSESDVEYLDLDDLVLLATALLGDPPPIRDLGLFARQQHDHEPRRSAPMRMRI
ncbi:MAG: hypothetical protein U5K30_11465 [Acidimicrobiales bacterium]|nr:hypothetical protein [Acidimicrobiales bacterium]